MRILPMAHFSLRMAVSVTWRGALALTIAWVGLPSVRAADHWVARGGRDSSGPGSRARPWATLQYAADRVRPGDTVYVGDGDYEGFDLRRGGLSGAPIAFKAAGKRARIVRPNRKTPDGINLEETSHVTIDGFIIEGMPRAGVRGYAGSHLTVRGVRADRNGVWGIFLAHCDDAAIVGNHTSNSVKEHGIYLSDSSDRAVIRSNVARGNRVCGIHMNGDKSQGGDGIISGALVEGNIISGSGRGGGSGINGDGVQDSVFANNLLYDNHAGGITLYQIDAGGRSDNNRVVNNTVVMARDARWALNIMAGGGTRAWNNILLNENPARGSIAVDAADVAGLRSDYNILSDRLTTDDGDHVMPLADWRAATGQDRHSRTAKPRDLFRDPVAGDFRLRANSPAIDAADPSVAPRQDLEGHPRPSGSGPDIGAFEGLAEAAGGRGPLVAPAAGSRGR